MPCRISTSCLELPASSLDTSLINKHIDTMTLEEVASLEREQDVVRSNSKADVKDDFMGVVEELQVEEGEAGKSFYSKGSVIMMVIFSGLAIGSDG